MFFVKVSTFPCELYTHFESICTLNQYISLKLGIHTLGTYVQYIPLYTYVYYLYFFWIGFYFSTADVTTPLLRGTAGWPLRLAPRYKIHKIRVGVDR